ncbi:MAG: hypothetical protein HZB41_03215 [Ignavibacteriae bacterium]|nr:hypothetical protein [Ignavibacteriota bacterium]
MKQIFVLLLILIINQLLFSQKAHPCGNNRWEVKILADNEAKEIKFEPIPIDYKALKVLDKNTRLSKENGDENKARLMDEKQVYRIKGKLKEWSEQNDNDYHLNIMLDKKHSIVCEIPSPDLCPEVRKTKFAMLYQKCRNKILSITYPHGIVNDGSSEHKLEHKVKVEIDGVLFHDLKHKKSKDAMPHFLELHPVLNINIIE